MWSRLPSPFSTERSFFTIPQAMKSKKSYCEVEKRRVERAEGWFKDLGTLVHSKVQFGRKSQANPVRIAHLDTGIDFNHADMKAAVFAGKIKAYRGFPAGL